MTLNVSLLRPGVIKQHKTKPNLLLKTLFILCGVTVENIIDLLQDSYFPKCNMIYC